MEPLSLPLLLDPGAYAPEKAHPGDAGFDLRVPARVVLPAHGSITVDTGVHLLIPYGYVGFLKSKSGLNVRHGLRGEGVIDAGYTGSIVVKMYSDSDTDHVFERGDKLIQLVILPLPEVTLIPAASLEETARGASGFGSSGK